jgi:hypothetical protein
MIQRMNMDQQKIKLEILNNEMISKQIQVQEYQHDQLLEQEQILKEDEVKMN